MRVGILILFLTTYPLTNFHICCFLTNSNLSLISNTLLPDDFFWSPEEREALCLLGLLSSWSVTLELLMGHLATTQREPASKQSQQRNIEPWRFWKAPLEHLDPAVPEALSVTCTNKLLLFLKPLCYYFVCLFVLTDAQGALSSKFVLSLTHSSCKSRTLLKKVPNPRTTSHPSLQHLNVYWECLLGSLAQLPASVMLPKTT